MVYFYYFFKFHLLKKLCLICYALFLLRLLNLLHMVKYFKSNFHSFLFVGRGVESWLSLVLLLEGVLAELGILKLGESKKYREESPKRISFFFFLSLCLSVIGRGISAVVDVHSACLKIILMFDLSQEKTNTQYAWCLFHKFYSLWNYVYLSTL